jgi:hypothetical protein
MNLMQINNRTNLKYSHNNSAKKINLTGSAEEIVREHGNWQVMAVVEFRCKTHE